MDIQELTNEVNRTSNEISQNQIKKLLYVSEKGKHTCHECAKNDGKIFDVNNPSLPRLPIHPNCRCKFVPVSNPEQDVSDEVEKYRVVKLLKANHQIKTEDAAILAEQVIKSRHENKKLREQNLFLIFNGRYLMSSDGALLLDAVSGKSVAENTILNHSTVSGFTFYTTEDIFDYSHIRQGIKKQGGLPVGLYYIKAEEERSAATSPWSHIINSPAWGYYSWSLHPDEETDTRSRDGFFIHGGWEFGTGGCIDLRENDSVFQQYFQSTGLQSIHVYVRYEKETVKIREKKTKFYPTSPYWY